MARSSPGKISPDQLLPIYDGLATSRIVAGDEAGATEMQAKASAVLEEAGYTPESLLALPFLT